MATPLQDLVSGAGPATLWCCRRGADEPCSWEEGLAPMLCHSSSTSLPSCHGCAPDGGLMGLVLSPLPPKTALTLGVQQVSWREGHAHACVLQLCWRVCPHHLLPGMPLDLGLGLPAWFSTPWGHLASLLPFLYLLGCWVGSVGQPPSLPASFSCRSSWSTSPSSRTSLGTTAWPISWKPSSGCCVQTPSSSSESRARPVSAVG